MCFQTRGIATESFNYNKDSTGQDPFIIKKWSSRVLGRQTQNRSQTTEIDGILCHGNTGLILALVWRGLGAFKSTALNTACSLV